MKNRIFILFLFLNYALYGFTGLVVDTKGKAISDVLVKAKTGYCFTDKNGRFHFFSLSKKDTVLFHKLGYKNKSIRAKDLKNPVIMEVMPINLRGVSVSAEYEKLSPDEKIIINANKTKDLASLLSAVSEFNIKGKSLSGDRRTVSIGGNLSKHTVIMLDGIVLNDAGQDFDISQIPQELLDRIEIIKNNASSIAGSGAIGGIINFITKPTHKEQPFAFETAASVGSFSKYSLSQKLSFYKKAGFDLFIKKEYAKNNFKYIYPFSNDKPEYIRKNNFFNMQIVDFDGSYKDFRLKFIFQNTKKGLPGTIDKIPMFDKSRLEAQKTKFILNYKKSLKKLSVLLNFYNFKDVTLYDNTKSTVPLYKSKTKTYENKIGFVAKQNFNSKVFDFGFTQEFKREFFNFKDITTPQNSIGKIHQDLYALSNYIKTDYELGKLGFITQVNVRMDITKRISENMKKYFSNRLSQEIKFKGIPNQKLTFHAGNSFSLPSFYDIYWKGDIQTQGNKDLKAEKSKGFGVNYIFGYYNLTAEISYDFNKINNLIYWYKSVLAWKPGNIANAEIQNKTFSLKYDFKTVGLKAEYTKTKALDKTILSDGSHSVYYNKNLTNVPNSKLVLETGFNLGIILLKFRYSEIGKRWVTRDNLWGYLPKYSILDASLRLNYKICNDYIFGLNFTMDNLLNTEYDVYQSMPGPNANFEIKFTLEKK